MEKNPFACGFGDLIVYQKARNVAREVFDVTRAFPREEMYSLTDQMRRSSRSIGAQVAEAWAKRRYPNHFSSKLTDADGEQNETRHWLTVAADCGYLACETADAIAVRLHEVGRMLQSMIARADEFRGTDHARVREEASSYGAIDDFFSENRPLNTEH